MKRIIIRTVIEAWKEAAFDVIDKSTTGADLYIQSEAGRGNDVSGTVWRDIKSEYTKNSFTSEQCTYSLMQSTFMITSAGTKVAVRKSSSQIDIFKISKTLSL